MAGRPSGSQNKDKPFRDALRMEIAEAAEDRRDLRRIARKLLSKAEEGDVQAIREVADRLDGKVPQAVIGDSESDPINVISEIRRVIVDKPGNPDGTDLPPAA